MFSKNSVVVTYFNKWTFSQVIVFEWIIKYFITDDNDLPIFTNIYVSHIYMSFTSISFTSMSFTSMSFTSMSFTSMSVTSM